MTVSPAADWNAFVDCWLSACADDRELTGLSVAAEADFAVRYGQNTVAFAISDGRVSAAAADSVPEFTLDAPACDWDEFLNAEPKPPYQSWFGMLMRVEGASVSGSELSFAQHVHVVRRVLELARETASGATAFEPENAEPETDARSGSYLQLAVAGRQVSVYLEQNGSDHPVVLLHTAGADSRQYRHLMNDSRLTAGHRLIAFDLPGHGKSGMLGDMRPGEQSLTTDDYAETVIALVRALGLRQPIIVGASMAGAICLEMAWCYPDEIGGVVACEASQYVEGRQVRWAKHPLINESLFVPEWVDGLMAPKSPRKHRDEIWWGYSQGGFGTFFGDILFYSGEWDARARVGEIDTARCPVAMLTGEYDYSCTPQMSQATAAEIPGATFKVMRGLGHFPHAENPCRFAGYLLPELNRIIDTALREEHP